MRKPSQFFQKNALQFVHAKASTMNVFLKTGPNAKSGKERCTIERGTNVFIVGESVVGGSETIGGRL